MIAASHPLGISSLGVEHRNRAWRDRFHARWHYDDCGGWIRTGALDEESLFGMRPTENFGPFTEDDACPCCLRRHRAAGACLAPDGSVPQARGRARGVVR